MIPNSEWPIYDDALGEFVMLVQQTGAEVYGITCDECLQRHNEALRAWSNHERKLQHVDDTQEIPPGWIVNQAVMLPDAQAVADAKMEEYSEYKLTHQPETGDSVNDVLIKSANAHNVKAFEWRRTHPDWRTRR